MAQPTPPPALCGVDSTTAELRSITASDAEKQRMLDILQKLHEQKLDDDVHSGANSSSEDEAQGQLSQQTIQQLARKLEAGQEVTAADLTPEELQAFHREVAAGAVSEVVQPWQPWWLSAEAAELELGDGGSSLVAPLAEAAGAAEPALATASGASALPPPPSKPLPPLAALTKSRPSPLLQYHLLDLLYAYCYVLRLYNGDYTADPSEAADLVFALSGVLAAAAGAQGPSVGMEASSPTAASVLLDSIRPPAGTRQQQRAAVAVLTDVIAVLQLGRAVVVTALMDLSRLLEAARRQLEDGPAWLGGSGAATKDAKRLQRKLVAAERKLLFFLSWANEQPQEAYGLLALAASTEAEKHLSVLQGGGKAGSVEMPGVGRTDLLAGSAEPAGGHASGPLVQEL
ncbi:hypothetical protein N2152v2_006029 [Parachlorella kessleri]